MSKFSDAWSRDGVLVTYVCHSQATCFLLMSFPRGRAGGIRIIEFLLLLLSGKYDRNYLRVAGFMLISIDLLPDHNGYSNICEIHWVYLYLFC